MNPLKDIVRELGEIAYQFKELNKNLEGICHELCNLTEVNEHFGELTAYLSSIDDSLEKIKNNTDAKNE